MKILRMTTLNKRLAVVLAALIVVYALGIVFHAAGRESNVQAVILHADTAGVTEIDLYPVKMQRQEIRLLRQDGKWMLRSGAVGAEPAPGSAEDLLSSLATIPTQRLISRRKNEWDRYRVGDTTGTRVAVYRGKDLVGDYYIGAGGGAYGGTTYIRENGHDEVYSTDEYLPAMVDKKLDDWRDRSFLRFSTGDISGIHFGGVPALVLSRKDSVWWLGQRRVPTDSVNRYLGRLQSVYPDRWADDFTASGAPDRSLVLSAGTAPVAVVKSWRRADSSWVVNSSQNAGAFFVVSDSVMETMLWRNPGLWVK